MSRNDFQTILLDPISHGFEQLYILTADASPIMASLFLKKIETLRDSFKLSLLIGMSMKTGINSSYHAGFRSLCPRPIQGDNLEFMCSYKTEGEPFHGNLYIWMKNGHPSLAYSGSAQFQQQSFLSSAQETMSRCDAETALKIYESEESQAIYCTHNEVEENVVIYSLRQPDTFNNDDTITLSLLAKTGDVGNRSGLNWGQREGRNPNQAYIPLPSKFAQSGFFPLDGHFMVLTDDKKTLILRVEQQNDKAITTPMNNSSLGEYFRNRLGLANGAYVTKQDLEKYGRTDVTFHKIDEETFTMDFSVE